jgi:hypothetical protein
LEKDEQREMGARFCQGDKEYIVEQMEAWAFTLAAGNVEARFAVVGHSF